MLQLIYPGTQEEGYVSRINPGRISWPWYTQQQSIPCWVSSLTSAVGNTVLLSGKHKQNMKQRWLYQQDDTGCNTTIILTLINQANRKIKQQWCNLFVEVCSVNLLDQSYRLSSDLLMKLILSILLIASIVSILAFSITVRCNWRMIQTTQQILGNNFRVKRGTFRDYWHLLAFANISRGLFEIYIKYP